MTATKSEQSFFQRVAALAERFEFNARLFVLVVVAACAVEILLGWNAFFKEVSVIRGRLREKGCSYAGVLSRAVLPALLAYDWDRMELLAGQMLDDSDVVALRFYDTRGQLVFHRGRSSKDTLPSAPLPLQGFTARWDRNARRIVSDPLVGLSLAREETRRDLIQSYNDLLADVKTRFGAASEPGKRSAAEGYYQDRLSPPEDGLAYALHPVRDKLGRVWGAVCIAFSLDRVHEEIHGSFMSNLAMTLFFVALVAVNQILTRREKLQTRAMADEIAEAKRFFQTLLPPPPPPTAGFALDASHLQASHMGGGFWAAAPRKEGLDLFVANGSTAGLAASYEAAMLEGLALRRMGEEAPDEGRAFLEGLAEDAHKAGVSGSLDACYCQLRRGDGDAVIEWCCSGGASPILLREELPLPEAEDLLRRRGETLRPGRKGRQERGRMDLRSGDRILLFDDGLPDGAEERRFDGKALQQLIADGTITASTLTARVAASYDTELPDDVLALVIDVE